MHSSKSLFLRHQSSNGRNTSNRRTTKINDLDPDLPKSSVSFAVDTSDEVSSRVKGQKAVRGYGTRGSSLLERWNLKRKRFFLRLLALKRRAVANVQNQNIRQGHGRPGTYCIVMGAWVVFLVVYGYQAVFLWRQQRVRGPLIQQGMTQELLERYYSHHHAGNHKNSHPIQMKCYGNDTLVLQDEHGGIHSIFRKKWASSRQQGRRSHGLRPIYEYVEDGPMGMTRDHHHHSSEQDEQEQKQEKEDESDLPKSIWDDEWYDEEYRRPFEPYKDMPQCKPMHSWQTSHRPNCNLVHEQPLDDEKWGKFLARGHFRQTFQIYDPGTDLPVAMKTLKSSREFNANLMESHRVDAVIYERTTASPWIMDIYGYCGYSGLFEYASDGNMADHVLHHQENGMDPLSRLEKLSLAIQAASAIASLHSTDNVMGYSAMMHTDIFLNQFVWSGNRFKLNDFNRGHLLWWDEKEGENCPYVSNHGNAGNARVS